jgi:protein phosphatase
MSKNDPELSGMGTTVVVAIVVDESVYVAHAGDSRAYILSNNQLYQLTKDHSLVQEMVDCGKITPEEAREHPKKNLITRALGVSEELRIDFCEESISENDVLLICTDGLTNFVEAEEIYELTEDGKFYEYAERLVNRANHNGGGDNITVVTVSY